MMPPSLAPPVVIASAEVLVGVCAWSNRSLTKETDWYPRKSMKAAERLSYYATQFPIAEVESTYWFPPTPEVTRQWAERTPEGFVFDVRTWSLLTGQPTLPPSLWPDLQPEVRPETRDNANLYASHLSGEALAESWARFSHALRPLQEAGRLGAVLLLYPHWFTPKDQTREEIARARTALGDYRVSVEFASERWLNPDELDTTLELCETLGITLVGSDAAALPAVAAATADLAVVRLHGRGEPHWGPMPHRPTWRVPYRYTEAELAEWAARIVELASSAARVHVLFNNCHRDDAVTNAAMMVRLLQDRAT